MTEQQEPASMTLMLLGQALTASAAGAHCHQHITDDKHHTGWPELELGLGEPAMLQIYLAAAPCPEFEAGHAPQPACQRLCQVMPGCADGCHARAHCDEVSEWLALPRYPTV
jgi:hypothetical protein